LLPFTFIIGFLILAAGILLARYPTGGVHNTLRQYYTLEKACQSRWVKGYINIITLKKKSSMYKFSKRILEASESRLSIDALYLVKIISFVCAALIILSVKYTNADAIKSSLVAKGAWTSTLFGAGEDNPNTYNRRMYDKVIAQVGIRALKRADSSGQRSLVRSALASQAGKVDATELDLKTDILIGTFNAVNKVKIIDWMSVVIIVFFFWLPEALLALKKVFNGSAYKKEIIKLESIFELMGSVKGYKTVDIINEMSGSSKVYKKHLHECRHLFQTEKELALETLKASSRNGRFARLADILRIYSLIDKKLALQILDRSRSEKEDEILLTAEEDVDMADILAFMSIAPIMFELANLLMRPMLGVIYEAFNFI